MTLRTTYLLLMRRNHVCGNSFDQGLQSLVGDRPPKVEVGLCGPHSCWVCLRHPIGSFKVYQESDYCLFQTIKCFNFQHSLFGRSYFQREGNSSHVTTPWGGGMQAKASKIVILCYFPSIFYPINYCKNIQNIKNCLLLPTPPTGGGVWCDIPAVKSRTTAHQMV